MKKLAFVILLFMAFQYITGYKTCGLTKIEYVLLGKEKYQSGFMYRLVNPIISVPENYFDKYYWVLHILWILILGYQLYNSNCIIL